jgi:hypothetical protein
MQAFDTSSEKKAMAMPKLTAQSLQYGRDELPFLAFGGTEKPRNYVSEYMHAEGHKKDWNPANTYGNLGKGEYTAKYGLIWDGETEIYDKSGREARNQMMHMTMAPEKMQGTVGATIEKEGRIECTPGYVLKNGVCVLQPTVAVCQPGWRKENGVCVKGPREFMQAQGSFGTAEVNEKYPMTKDSVLSLKRLRSYVQEKNEGTPTSSPSSLFNEGMGPFIILFFLLVVVAMGATFMKKNNQ